MESDLFAKALDTLMASGPVAAILAAAVWWLMRGNQALVKQLNDERGERMDAMDQEIDRLRQRSDRCEADRLELHKQVAQLMVRD